MRFIQLPGGRLFSIINSSLVRSTGIYMGSSLLGALGPFLMMPILTRFLTPIDYGIVSMFTVLVSLLAPFTGLSIHGAVYRQYFELDKSEMGVYIANTLGILLCSTAFVALAFLIFINEISDLTSIPAPWIWAVLIVSMTSFICNILLAIWQVEMKSLLFGSFQIAKTLANIGLSIVFVVGFNLSWRGSLLGVLVNAITFGVVALYLLRRQNWLRFKLNKEYVKNALNFGVPMVPTALKGSVMAIIDKLFITNMVGIGATGIYSVGLQLSMALSLLTSSFNSAYVPWLFKNLKSNDENIDKKIVKLTYAYFFTIISIAFVWSFVAGKIISVFVGPRFTDAKPFIFWLSLGFAFSGMHSMVVNYIYFAQKTARYSLVSVMSVFCNIALNYILILNNGPVGAAQATCITYLFTFLMTWRLSSQVHPMPWFYFFKGGKK